ncbi:hypothetical protein SprV_0602117200 [Sparganum proliferum]
MNSITMSIDKCSLKIPSCTTPVFVAVNFRKTGLRTPRAGDINSVELAAQKRGLIRKQRIDNYKSDHGGDLFWVIFLKFNDWLTGRTPAGEAEMRWSAPCAEPQLSNTRSLPWPMSNNSSNSQMTGRLSSRDPVRRNSKLPFSRETPYSTLRRCDRKRDASRQFGIHGLAAS